MVDRFDLPGANCSDLAPPAIEHLFDDPGRDPIRLKAAKNICARCVVLDECRREVLVGRIRETGFMAGMRIKERRNARAWHQYELGLRGLPKGERPEWLTVPDAVHTVVEAGLVEDPDEDYGSVV